MFKILNKKSDKKSSFGALSNNTVSSKDSREWRNIGIIKEILKGEYSNAHEFTGFGGLYKALQNKEVQETLTDLLTASEWESLRKSTSTAYYTPKEVIKYCWKIAEQLGFKGGDILEPTCGVGSFFQHMPEVLRKNSNITGIELEKVSAHIASALYSDINIINDGYQSHQGDYDLIIGNPPYATFNVKDRHYSDLNDLKIHHAFLARSVRLLKDDGICIMVVPSYCLDSSTNHARDIISKEAQMICSYRLPDCLFSDAKVTTDIVVFQKRAKPNNKHLGLTEIELNCGYKNVISDYYIDNQDHILGDMKTYEVYMPKDKRTRKGLKVVGSIHDLDDKLPKLISKLEPLNKENSKAADEAVFGITKSNKPRLLSSAKELRKQIEILSQEYQELRYEQDESLAKLTDELFVLAERVEQLTLIDEAA